MFKHPALRERSIDHDHARDRAHDASRKAPHPDHHVANAIGKATLAERCTPRHLAPPDTRTHAIETARREIGAIRAVLMPAFIKALRTKNRIELSTATTQLRYMLMRANQQVFSLEKAATYTDPLIVFLRKEVDTLAARATRLGAYKGVEHLVPRGYEDPIKPNLPAIKRKPRPTDHKHEPAPPSAHVSRWFPKKAA
ncbi:MAG TPA: hypothetical protein VMZ53_05835 [Kofleriaceae bacterium]|nr:hypothetical protein [Kofleriaceae bacterium]